MQFRSRGLEVRPFPFEHTWSTPPSDRGVPKFEVRPLTLRYVQYKTRGFTSRRSGFSAANGQGTMTPPQSLLAGIICGTTLAGFGAAKSGGECRRARDGTNRRRDEMP